MEGGVTLTREWQQFKIDISPYEMESILGAFAWVIDFPDTEDPATAEPRILYLDDIVWE